MNTGTHMRRTDAAKQAIANFDRNHMQQKIQSPILKEGQADNKRSDKRS